MPEMSVWGRPRELPEQRHSSPPTFNLHVPSLHLGTCQPNLDMQDEHTASPSLDIHTIDDERCSTTASSLSILLPPPLIFEDCLDKLLVPLDHSFTNYCPTLAHTSNMGQGLLAQGQLGNLKDSVKDAGTGEQVTVGNSTGWGNPHGLQVRVTYGTGTGQDSPTRELSNEPKNVIFGQKLREL